MHDFDTVVGLSTQYLDTFPFGLPVQALAILAKLALFSELIQSQTGLKRLFS